MAYAILAGQPAVVMDPGKCCAGTPVNGHCARRILTALHAAQITVILPIDLPGVERIHQNEQRWLAHLTEQAALMGTMKSMRYWDVLEGGTTRVTGRPELPCEVAVAPGLRR
jgi:hypothetical protein